MDVKLIAKTHPKQSYSDIDLQFFTEYSLGYNLTQDEKETFANGYSMGNVIWQYSNPIVTLRRRVDLRDGQETPWDWDYFYEAYETDLDAMKSFGDSAYWDYSISVDPRHSELVEKMDNLSKYQMEIYQFEGYLISEKFSRSDIEIEFSELYEKKLKDARIFSAAQRGDAPQDKIDEIRAEVKRLYDAKKLKIETEIENLKELIVKLDL